MAGRRRGCCGSWDRIKSLVLVFRKRLDLVGSQDGEGFSRGWYGRQISKVVIRRGIQGNATSSNARAGHQLLLRVDIGEQAGAKRWDMAWVGTLDPTPHKDLGSSEAVPLILPVCFHSVTFQPSDRSREPAANLGGEDAGRPGQPGGETTPTDCRVFCI